MLPKIEKEHKNGIRPGTIIKCLAITALILIGVNNKAVMIAAVLVASIFVILSEPQEIVEILMYTVSFSVVFKLNPGNMTLFNVLIFISIIKLLVIIKKLYLSKNLLVLLPIFAVYIIFSGGLSSLVTLVQMIMYFFLLLLLLQQKEEFDIKSILFFFSLGIIVTSIVGIYSKYIPGLDSYMEIISFRVGDEHILRFGGLRTNPNFYTMPIIMAVSCLIALIQTGKASVKEYILFIVLTIFGISSISMSFLVSYLVMLLLSFIYLATKNIKSLIIGIAVILLSCIVVYVFSDTEYIQSYILRLSEKDLSSASDLTTGRTDIWQVFMQYIILNPKVLLYGAGFGSMIAPHNTFIEALYYFGIFGIIQYLLILKQIFPKSNNKKNIVNFIPLFILLVRYMGIGYLLDDNIYMFYILIYLMVRTDFNIKSDEGVDEIENNQQCIKLTKNHMLENQIW